MYDAIVVGARCAGAAMTMLLARRGHRVLMVDKDARGEEMKHSTHFLHARAVAHLRRWGLLPALEAACPGSDHYELDFGTLRISGRPPAVDGDARGYCPRRFVIDPLLVAAAEAAGAEYRPDTRVDGVLRDGDRVTGVTLVDAQGVRSSVPARVVVGADGPASTIAKSTGAARYAEAPAQQVTVWGYWQGATGDRLRFCTKPGLGVYMFPTARDQLMVGVNWEMSRYKALPVSPEEDYHAQIADLDPALHERLRTAELSEPLRRGSTSNFLRVPYGPGWVLIGDAGHKKDPCTAQGISDAFTDVDDVAHLLDDGLNGTSDLEASLRDWHARRDARLLPLHHMTIQMASFAPPSDEEFALYRAIEAQPAATTAFLGLLSGATDPTAFFAPENLGAIMAGAGAV